MFGELWSSRFVISSIESGFHDTFVGLITGVWSKLCSLLLFSFVFYCKENGRGQNTN